MAVIAGMQSTPVVGNDPAYCVTSHPVEKRTFDNGVTEVATCLASTLDAAAMAFQVIEINLCHNCFSVNHRVPR